MTKGELLSVYGNATGGVGSWLGPWRGGMLRLHASHSVGGEVWGVGMERLRLPGGLVISVGTGYVQPCSSPTAHMGGRQRTRLLAEELLIVVLRTNGGSRPGL